MNNNSNIQNSLFEAMQIFSKRATENSNATITVECLITEIVDAGTNEYYVEYLGNKFKAHTNNNATYSVGDNVYVLIPNGDFTKEKIILGTVSASATIAADNDSAKKKYYDISDNLIDRELGVIKLSSYKDTVVTKTTTKIDAVAFGNLMNGYLSNYRIFKLSFSAQTSLELEQQTKGNYGVSLSIPVKRNGKAEDKIVTLDVGNMYGNPYRLSTWSPQEVYFKIDDELEYDSERVPSITYFCKDFAQDSSKEDIKDIWLKDISFQVTNAYPEGAEKGYSLTLTASQGEYFSTFYATEKKLTPHLRIDGKETSLRKAEIYWFKENTGIKQSDSKYHIHGGIGWECINPRVNVIRNADGTESFDYITNMEVLAVQDADVGASAQYKCVVVYQGKSMAAAITLKNLKVDASFQLLTGNSIEIIKDKAIIKNGNSVFIKDTGTVELVALTYYAGITHIRDNWTNVTYSWARYDKDGKFIPDNDSFFKILDYNKIVSIDGKQYYMTRVSYPVNQLEDVNTIYCTVKYIDRDRVKLPVEKIIGTSSIVVSTTTDYDFNLSIDGDDIIYKYDVDGDSPAGPAYDGPSTSKITSIAPLTFHLKKLDGTELTTEEYYRLKYTWEIPEDSLFAIDPSCPPTKIENGIRYYEGIGNNFKLFYKIAQRYNLTKAKKSANLTIQFNDMTATRSASITFLKEGMTGTNGTAYSALIVSGGNSANDSKSVGYGVPSAEGVAQKLKFVYNISDGNLYRVDYENNKLVLWEDSIKRLYIKAWRDSSLMYHDTHYRVEWTMFDAKNTNACFMLEGQTAANDVNNNQPIQSADVKLKLLKNPTDLNTVYSSIVQAKVVVTDGQNSSVNSNQIIYAYYPIELTVVKTLVDGTIPSLDGGFAEVIYASDGTNPKWDESTPFTLKGLDLDYYDIQWEAKNHLGFYSNVGRKENTFTGTQANIKPDNKYDSGNSLNYVKVKLTFNESKENDLAAKQVELQEEQESTAAKIKVLDANLSYLKELANRYSYTDVSSISGLLKLQTEAKLFLDELIDTDIKNFKEYVSMQKRFNDKARLLDNYCGRILSEVNSLEIKVKEAIVKLKNLDGTTGNSISDLVLLKNNKIQFDIDVYIPDIGRELAVSLDSIIDSINNNIKSYEFKLSKIIEGSFDSDLERYRELKNNIKFMAEAISSEAYPQYKRLKEDIIAYANEFDNITSLYEVMKLTDELNRNILSPIYEISGDRLSLMPYVNDEFAYEKKLLIDKENENLKEQKHLSAILSTKGQEIVHIRPIVLYFNRYEMSNLNAWDGNKVEIGDGYLLAPQVGAGVKEADNSFTGVVMGVKKIASTANYRKGLFGYAKGTQSFALDAENGSAIFGKAGTGQIIVDPSEKNTLLYSSNYYTSYDPNTGLPTNYNSKTSQGMCIDLKSGEVHLGSAATGKIYSGEHSTLGSAKDGFYLSHDGLSIGSDFTISSQGMAKMLHEGSDFGNWKLDARGRLVSKKNAGIALDSPNSLIVLGSSDGAIYSGGHSSIDSDRNRGFYLSNEGLSITGEGKFMLKTTGNPIMHTGRHDSLSSSQDGFYLSDDGLSIGSKFFVDANDGSVRIGDGATTRPNGKNWKINTNSQGTYIAYNTTSFSDTRGVYLGTDGIRLNSKFSVDDKGALSSTLGNIGGWVIGDTTLSARNLVLNSNGSISASGRAYNWSIGTDGAASFSKITADNSGSIGGWTINSWGLSKNNIELRSDGSIRNGTNWSIDSSGNARFNNITCNNKWSFGTGQNVWTDTGGFTFNSGSLGTNRVSAGGLGFTKGTVGLGTSVKGGNGIAYDGNKCIIAGDIYANNGYFSGDINAKSFLFDGGSSGGILKMGHGTNHPFVSGLNIGPGGIQVMVPNRTGATVSAIDFVSDITGMRVSSSGGGEGSSVDVDVTLYYKKRSFRFDSGIMTGVVNEVRHEVGDSG